MFTLKIRSNFKLCVTCPPLLAAHVGQSAANVITPTFHLHDIRSPHDHTLPFESYVTVALFQYVGSTPFMGGITLRPPPPRRCSLRLTISIPNCVHSVYPLNGYALLTPGHDSHCVRFCLSYTPGGRTYISMFMLRCIFGSGKQI